LAVERWVEGFDGEDDGIDGGDDGVKPEEVIRPE